MLTVDGSENSLQRSDFDVDMLQSLESDLKSIKCRNRYRKSNSLYYHWSPDPVDDQLSPSGPSSPFSKVSLPFWFVQLEDGSIPEIRFTKGETEREVKNLKKFVATLLTTQLNQSNASPLERTVFGVHRSRYRIAAQNISTTATTNDRISMIDKHIDSADFVADDSHNDSELSATTNELPVMEVNQSQTIDHRQHAIVQTTGSTSVEFGPSELRPYLKLSSQFSLKV